MSFNDTLLGKLPSEWKIDVMENALESIIDYRGKTPRKSDKGILTLSAKSVKTGFIDYQNAYTISAETYKEFMVRGIPKVGDILMTTEAPLGCIAKLDRGDVGIAQRLLTLRGRTGYLLNDYLMYYLMSHIGQHQLKSRATGTTVTGIKQSEFRKTLVVIPPLAEQKVIADTISCIDEKIALNNYINKNLEEISKSIFINWFVDFEPFQSGEFEESEIGKIPKGWRIGTFNDVAEICIGGDWGKESKEPGLLPVICLRGTDLQSLKGLGYSYNAPLRWVKSNSIIKREITERDILIGGSGIGPIGRSLFCSDTIKALYNYPLIYSNFCKKIRSKNHQTAIYLESVIENLYVQGALNSYMNGTSIPNLDINSLMKLELLIPSDEVIFKFAEFKKLLFKSKFSKENFQLNAIKDSILPRLMSGAIRVQLEEGQ
jgi:type I restriction enzyme S subunit